jgi:FixJ family two-component response regulator
MGFLGAGLMDHAPILIVDDDPLLHESLAVALTLNGYDVRHAINGLEGLSDIQMVRPSVVLLDSQMPVMDGREFVSALRERNIELPLIIMSGRSEARELAEKAGAVAFLEKPFAMQQLLAAVSASMSIDEQSRQVSRAA